MLSWISRFLDRLFAVGGAFLFSQFPAYFQQYTQRLAGHLAELNYHLAELSRIAQASGKSLTAYIHKFSTNPDLDFAQQGVMMQGLIERQYILSDAYRKLTEASLFAKPYLFSVHFQADIAKGTLHDFQPALAFTAEGLLYAILGIVFGYAIYSSICSFCRMTYLLSLK